MLASHILCRLTDGHIRRHGGCCRRRPPQKKKKDTPDSAWQGHHGPAANETPLLAGKGGGGRNKKPPLPFSFPPRRSHLLVADSSQCPARLAGLTATTAPQPQPGEGGHWDGWVGSAPPPPQLLPHVCPPTLSSNAHSPPPRGIPLHLPMQTPTGDRGPARPGRWEGGGGTPPPPLF